MKYKIIALIGKSGAGKDTILNSIIAGNTNLNKIITCTTRPPRDGEENGIDYYFLDEPTFLEMVLMEEIIEASYFNDWCYGTKISSLSKEKINIGVFNPSSIRSLLEHLDVIDLTVIYIDVEDKRRLLRQLERELYPNTDEIVRRYIADKEDFKDLDFDFIKKENNTATDYVELLNFLKDLIEERKEK